MAALLSLLILHACCAVAVAVAVAAAFLHLLCPACAMQHAMLYAMAFGALRSSDALVACMQMRAGGKGRVLWAGSLGSRALALTCVAESMMSNSMRETCSLPMEGAPGR